MNLSNQVKIPAAPRQILPPDQTARLISLVLALVTMLVYLPAGFCEFTNLDDADYVTDNLMVQNGLSWAGLKWAFIGWHASNWHPLTWLSHELDCQLFGLNAGAHHLVNVLFHAVNTVLLFQLWFRLTGARWPSAIVAALFAWHPLHVESVAWVAERKDVLSTFFGLLALLAYTKFVHEAEMRSPQARTWYGLAVLAFALGLLAKPMLVTLPCVFLLLDYWPLQRLREGPAMGAQIRRLTWEKWPFFLMVAGSCILTWLAQRGLAVRSFDEYSPVLRAENVVVSYVAYLGKTFWPANLCASYPLVGHFSLLEVAVSAGLLTGISVGVWRGRQYRYLVTGWLWFLGTLVPVIGVVLVGSQSMADRYMYLPAVGVFTALVFGAADAQMAFKIPARLAGAVAALVLAVCIALTEHQLGYWRNSTVLFEHVLAVNENNGMAHMMLGSAYEKTGRDDDARREFHKALDIFATLKVKVDGEEMRPLAAQIHLLLGQAAEQKGQVTEAIDHYREVLRLDSRVVEAHNNLGNLLDDLGREEEALAEYQSAVQLKPETPVVHENLGTQFLKMGRFDAAMKEYKTAARLAPEDPQPVYLMGKALLRHGESAQAVSAFQSALRLSPNDCPSLVWLARVLAADQSARVRSGAQSVGLAEQANALTGGTQPAVLGALAMAYAESGRFEDARRTAQAAQGLVTAADPKIMAELQTQLRLYNAGQPFRESFTNQPSGR